MITGEIKLYNEPLPAYNSGYNVTFHSQSLAEKEAWHKRCHEDLDKAKQLFNVGDQIIVKNQARTLQTIVSFVEEVERMQRYQGNPCVVECKNMNFVNANSIQYSIEELDLATLIKLEIPNV
mgnify:FL=1